jgi:hypothetical protein
MVEWWLLWWPFLTSASLTILFSFGTWWKVHASQAVVNSERVGSMNSRHASMNRRLDGQKRRLLQIAAIVSLLLLVNVVVTVSISSSLEDWSRLNDTWLTCNLYETHGKRDFEHYPWLVPGQIVCNKGQIEKVAFGAECVGDCTFQPTTVMGESSFVCALNDEFDFQDSSNGNASPQESTHFETLTAQLSSPQQDVAYCGCSCDDIVPVEKPSVVMMTLCFSIQAAVGAVIGLNMAFRSASVHACLLYSNFTFLFHTDRPPFDLS